MVGASSNSDELDYLSFVDFAVERARQSLPAVDPLAMRLGLSLHRLVNALTYDWESTVHRPRGFSWAGFRVLFVLWLAGPLEAKRAAELSGMSRAAVSAVVNTLERERLVSRTTATHDRRAVRLSLTRSGRSAISDAYRAHNKREQAWMAALSVPERKALAVLVEKLINGPAARDAKRRV